MAATARDLGATSVGLICPYLPYMRRQTGLSQRQDGTARYFGEMVGRIVDWIITVDPHLGREQRLAEAYSIPVIVAHAGPMIAAWIHQHVESPIVVGPGRKSAQWAATVAQSGGGWLVLGPQRHGLHKRPVRERRLPTPVIVDDTISTGRTMATTIERLRRLGYPRPYCIAIHAVFRAGIPRHLIQCGARRVLTCNTIAHSTNAIDVTPALVQAVRQVRATIGFPERATVRHAKRRS